MEPASSVARSPAPLPVPAANWDQFPQRLLPAARGRCGCGSAAPGPAPPIPGHHRDGAAMAAEPEAEYESVLCVKPAVLVYRVPPRASNRGYRWGPRAASASRPGGFAGGPLVVRGVGVCASQEAFGAWRELPVLG